jgi:transposase InsO family protein
MPITLKGNRYIITAMDYFTRWPEAKAVPAATAFEAAKFIYEDIICRHGIVDIIHSDQGTHFNNELIAKLMDKFDMKHHQITAYHPQSNGLVERFNGTLKKTLVKIMENVEQWDEVKAPAHLAYRTGTIESIGTTPEFMEFGREIRVPRQQTQDETVWQRIKRLIEEVPILRKEAIKRLVQHQQKTPQPKRTNEFKVG